MTIIWIIVTWKRGSQSSFQRERELGNRSLTPITMCVFSYTTKQFSDTSWVSCSSAQWCHCLPGDRSDPKDGGSVLTTKPPPLLPLPPLQPPVATLGCRHLCFWPTSYIDQRFQRPPPWVQLICWSGSTELRETLYLLDYWFIIKGHMTQEQPDERDA